MVGRWKRQSNELRKEKEKKRARATERQMGGRMGEIEIE